MCLRPITCGCYRRARSGGRRWRHACGQTTAVSSSPRQRQEGCRPVGRHHQLLLVCSTVTVKHSCSPPTRHPTPVIHTTYYSRIPNTCSTSFRALSLREQKCLFPDVFVPFRNPGRGAQDDSKCGSAVWCGWRPREGCLSLVWAAASVKYTNRPPRPRTR